WRRRGSAYRLEILRADVAVAVPLGLAVLEPNAVDHAVTDEPVVAARVGLERVRADADVAARQLGRDGAGDLAIGQRQLLVQWGMDAGQEAMRLLVVLEATIDAGDRFDALGNDLADGALD